ncbi:MAG: hypothetical protein K0Q72_2200 [Armatimonadetes bacterium]|jgi:hypothetical protein|nr:hypothetical protein [Armatimonadota bacterium]
MPLLIDQNQILARPGETVEIKVHVVNDTGADSTFTVFVDPADWYDAEVPHQGHRVRNGKRQQYLVRLTPKRSPHGEARLSEVRIWAQQAVAGVAPPPAAPPAGRGGNRFVDGMAAVIDVEVPRPADVDPDIYQGRAPEPAPAPAPAPEPDPPANRVPPPPKKSSIALTNNPEGWVLIEQIPPHAGGGVSGTPIQTTDNAAGGSAHDAMEAIVYLYVPPIPKLDLSLVPYQPLIQRPGTAAPASAAATGPAGARPNAPASTGKVIPEKQPFTVRVGNQIKKWLFSSGDTPTAAIDRTQAYFKVRLVNHEPYLATVRLELLKPKGGSTYHIDEQFLKIPAKKTVETVLRVKASRLSWTRWLRPFEFTVQATPLTGAMAIDRNVAVTQIGTFHQHVAWLHPAPLLGVAAALLLLASTGTPDIRSFEVPTTRVLRRPFDLQDAVSSRRVIDEKAALAATADFGQESRAVVKWSVQGARSVRLEYRCDTWPDKKWRPIEGGSSQSSGELRTLLDPGDNANDCNFRFRLSATGLFPWAVSHSPSEPTCTLLIEPRAVISFGGENGEQLSPPLAAHNRGNLAVMVLKNANADTDKEHNYMFVRTKCSDRTISRPDVPNDPISLGPSSGDTWKYPLPANPENAVVTVIANAKNGVLWQYRMRP